MRRYLGRRRTYGRDWSAHRFDWRFALSVVAYRLTLMFRQVEPCFPDGASAYGCRSRRQRCPLECAQADDTLRRNRKADQICADHVALREARTRCRRETETAPDQGTSESDSSPWTSAYPLDRIDI